MRRQVMLLVQGWPSGCVSAGLLVLSKGSTLIGRAPLPVTVGLPWVSPGFRNPRQHLAAGEPLPGSTTELSSLVRLSELRTTEHMCVYGDLQELKCYDVPMLQCHGAVDLHTDTFRVGARRTWALFCNIAPR